MTDADHPDTLHVIVYSLDGQLFRRLTLTPLPDGALCITPDQRRPAVTRFATAAERTVLADLIYPSPSADLDNPSRTGIA